MPQNGKGKKTTKIDYYGTNKDFYQPSKVVTYKKPITSRLSNIQNFSTKLTLGDLLARDDPKKILELDSPEVFNGRKDHLLQGQESIVDNEVEQDIKKRQKELAIMDLRRRKEHIARYAKKTLDSLRTRNVKQKPQEMADMFQDVINLGLANTYNNMETMKYSASEILLLVNFALLFLLCFMFLIFFEIFTVLRTVK